MKKKAIQSQKSKYKNRKNTRNKDYITFLSKNNKHVCFEKNTGNWSN